MNQIIIFDTETFGIIDSLDNDISDLIKWPEIKQICWSIYNVKGYLIKNKNIYFNAGNGIEKKEILIEFAEDFKNSGLAIAHNFLFDYKIISAELLRNNIDTKKLKNSNVYDTMLNNVDLCKIENKFGFYKYPTLTELYEKLFQEKFEGAHNAENDVKATSKCFWHLRQSSKIDYDKLPKVENAIQLEEEKLLKELTFFYGTRLEFGKLLFDACRSGIIGHLIEQRKKEINSGNRINKNPLSIHSNPNLVIEWIEELEIVFLNTQESPIKYFEYAEYKSLKETVEFLKQKKIYFPRSSMKLDREIAELYLADFSKPTFSKLESIKLYKIIANIIKRHNELEKKFESEKELLKEDKGCLGVILFLITFGIIKYFT
jgi:DNA polymerase III epsilon subunit-like protein